MKEQNNVTSTSKIQNFRNKFTGCKFGQFWIKAHLQYLLLAILLYGFKAGLYFIITYIPCNPVMFNMPIDKAIPFVPEMFFFYVSYYILPEIFLWILSFFNKRKVFDLVIGAAIANILCCIAFLIQNVKMDRAAYEAIVAPYNLGDGSVTGWTTFWYACVNIQYHNDATALNCFPSLHATFGTMLFLIGVPLSKKEPHFPLWIRIICIVFGLGIVLSTFFIKQHYFIDAACGMILMIGCYFLAKFLINLCLKRKEKKLQAEPKIA